MQAAGHLAVLTQAYWCVTEDLETARANHGKGLEECSTAKSQALAASTKQEHKVMHEREDSRLKGELSRWEETMKVYHDDCEAEKLKRETEKKELEKKAAEVWQAAEEAKEEAKEEARRAKDSTSQAVEEFKVSQVLRDFLTTCYDGGWTTVMRCTLRTFPDTNWSKVEEAYLNYVWEGPLHEQDDVLDIHVGNVSPRLTGIDGPFSFFLHLPPVATPLLRQLLLVFFLAWVHIFIRAFSVWFG